MKKERWFLLAYTCVIAAGTFLSLRLAEKVTWAYQPAEIIWRGGESPDSGEPSGSFHSGATFEITDEKPLVFDLVLSAGNEDPGSREEMNPSSDTAGADPGWNPVGIWLDGLDTNGLVLTDEMLEVSIGILPPADPETVSFQQANLYSLHDLAARSTDNNSSRIYIPLDDTLRDQIRPVRSDGNAESGNFEIRLRVHLETQGLSSKGILFSPSAGVLSSAQDPDWYAGILWKAAVILLIGFGASVCAYVRKLPVWIPEGKSHVTITDSGGNIAVKPIWKRIFSFLSVPALGIVILVWGWRAGVGSASEKMVPEAAAVCSNPDVVGWSLVGDEAHALRQTFTVQNGRVSGIGIAIAPAGSGSVPEKTTGSGETVPSAESDGQDTGGVVLRLRDAAGNLIAENSLPAAELQPVTAVISQTDISLSGVIDSYYYLPFREEMILREGETYQIELFREKDAGMEDAQSKGAVDAVSARPEETGSEEMLASCLPEEEGGGLQLLLLSRGYRSLPSLYWGVTLSLLAVLCLVWWMVWVLRRREPFAFLLLFLSLGMVFSLSIPFYSAPDEKAHINTIYALSNRLVGFPDETGPDYVRESPGDVRILTEVDSVGVTALHPMMTEHLFRKEEAPHDYEAVYYQNTLGNTTVFNYLPALAGFTIGRLCGFNLPTRILLARWSNLIVCSILLFFGIRKSPVGRNAFMGVALFPMLLQMAASCSYDAVLIGTAFLFVGYAYHLLMDSDISLCDLVILLLSGALLLANKQGVYLPLLCLVLLAPVFHREKIYRRVCAFIALAGALFLAIGFLPGFFRDFVSPSSDYVQRFYSLADLAHDPGQLFRLIGSTIVSDTGRLVGNTIGDGLASFYVRLPAGLTILIGGLAVLWAVSPADHLRFGHRVARAWTAVILFFGILFLDLAALIGMTPKGADQITGLQGRYFLPYALLFGILISREEGGPVDSARPTSFGVGMGLADLAVVVMVFLRLYG